VASPISTAAKEAPALAGAKDFSSRSWRIPKVGPAGGADLEQYPNFQKENPELSSGLNAHAGP
jgi:hypothetical protein